jgi:hypothetical protein
MSCFHEEQEQTFDMMYDGDGHEMAGGFYVSVFRLSVKYYMVSGYFGVDSLVLVASGLAGLVSTWSMRPWL